MSETTVEPTSHKLEGKVSRKAAVLSTVIVGTLSVVALAMLKKSRRANTAVIESAEDTTN